MIEFLFIDMDDTILDFHTAERIALSKTFRSFGLEPTETVLQRYHVINKWYWEQLELGTMTRDQVINGRFETLFSEMGIDADASTVPGCYMQNLGQGHWFMPHAREAVEALSKKYRLFLASNGTTPVQKSRIASAGISRYFEQIFISQEVGYNKPAKEYFDICFSRISGFDPQKAMIVGDSLTSDIRGGINAGIKTCWVNPNHSPGREDIRPDYEIEGLYQLEALLDTL